MPGVGATMPGGGKGGPAPGGAAQAQAQMAAAMQQAQMQAMAMQNPYMMYGGYPGGGFPGQMGMGGGKGQFEDGGKGGYGGGKGFGGKGFGGMKGKGKGKGKGKRDGPRRPPGEPREDGEGGEGDAKEGEDSGSPRGPTDPRRQIEIAQRKAKTRDRSAISDAQRSAQQRFEKDILDRVQGKWVDTSEPGTTYTVEGSLCSVATEGGGRVFRNRLSVFGGELCWDARRFWHYLDLPALYAQEDKVERVEWKPGKGSPPTREIVWTPAPPEPEKTEGEEDGADAAGEVAASVAEAVVA